MSPCLSIGLCKLYKKDAMNEWGSIVALSCMAAQRVFPDYNDMADNKAFLKVLPEVLVITLERKM